ncbi:MAG TPA: YigZ family protein [Bacteroidales bacterium]|nr:YigZ family protein [Bacteroidales bacterium]
MLKTDTYLTIESPAEGIFKDKGSKFLSIAYPINNEIESKNLLDKVKSKYYNANHHCYAYRLGYNGEKYKYSDDKEPSGTAGKPILGQLISKNLTNIIVIIVRYFGGTKLGISGLINAYQQATISVINNANIIEKIIKENITISFYNNNMNQVMHILKQFNANLILNDYVDNKFIIQFSIRKSLKDDIYFKLSNINNLDFIEV